MLVLLLFELLHLVERVEHALIELLANLDDVLFVPEGDVVDGVREVDGGELRCVEDLVEDVAVSVGRDVEVAGHFVHDDVPN